MRWTDQTSRTFLTFIIIVIEFRYFNIFYIRHIRNIAIVKLFAFQRHIGHMPNHTLYAAERCTAAKASQGADLAPHGVAIAVELCIVRVIRDVVVKESFAYLAHKKAFRGC